MNRKEFADTAEAYIRRLNEIAEKQGFSIMTAFYIEGTPQEPSEFSIDFRNMTMDENLYALARWNQDLMNHYDDEEQQQGPKFGR
jgi:hypothetical protein